MGSRTWGAAALAALLAGTGGCAGVRAALGLDPEPLVALPAEPPPAAAFLGLDRVLSAPGEADGRLDRVVFPAAPAPHGRIAPGDSAVLLDLAGPGVIRRIRLSLASADPDHLRRIAIRMHWDGEVEPSVAVPLGDFFANAFDRRPYAAAAMGASADAWWSYLPMPFPAGARIVLDNGTGLPLDSVRFDADVEMDAALTAPVATFHALWSRDPRAGPERTHRVAELEGAGWFVGTSLSALGHDGTLGFLQGRGTFEVDGRRLEGAATAAYLNDAGAPGADALPGPFHGALVRDEERARFAGYRWHLPDPIPFRRSLRLELERGPANRDAADYATVAYWYQVEPHAPMPPLPRPAERRVPEVLVPPGAVHRDDLSLVGTGEGTMRVTLRAPRPDRYEVLIYPEANPGSATPTVAVAGGPARPVDVAPPGAEAGDVLPPLVLDTAAVAGRELVLELAAGGGGIALPAAILLRPVRGWATAWWAAGPWPAATLDSVWGPEVDPDLARAYGLPSGGEARWRPVEAEASGAVRTSASGSGAATAYAQAFLFSPDDRPVTLLVGTSGPHRMWIDGALVSDRPGSPPARPDAVEVPVFLRAGWSRVLVKVADSGTGARMFVRAADPTGDLRWARTREPEPAGERR